MSERIEAIPSACASQSQHLPAGDNWHLKSFFFLPAQRSVPFYSFHSAQKHKDSVSLESGQTFRRRHNRRLVWWINEFMHFAMTWLRALNWMHVRPPSLASVGFISAGVVFGHYVWFAGGIKHYFGCTRHFVVHVCVCARLRFVLWLYRVFNVYLILHHHNRRHHAM